MRKLPDEGLSFVVRSRRLSSVDAEAKQKKALHLLKGLPHKAFEVSFQADLNR